MIEKSFPPGYTNQGISHLFLKAHERVGDPLRRTIARMRVMSSLDQLKLNKKHVGHRRGDEIAPGLNEYLRGELKNGTPFYIIDQHGLIVGPIAEAVEEGHIVRSANMLVYDGHPDAKPPPLDLYLQVTRDYKQLTEQNALILAKEWKNNTDIERFNGVLQFLGFIDQSFWIGRPNSSLEGDSSLPLPNTFSTESIELADKPIFYRVPNPRVTRVEWDSEIIQHIKRRITPRNKIVTSPDMDAFEQLSQHEIETEMANLREVMLQSGLVVIATSPGFIDQKYAIHLTKQLLEPLL